MEFNTKLELFVSLLLPTLISVGVVIHGFVNGWF